MSKSAEQARNSLAVAFTFVLLVCAVVQTLTVVAGLKQRQMLTTPFTDDSSPALRLIVFLLGAGASWLLARIVYKRMVRGEVTLSDSANAAFVMLFLALLLSATLAFLNVISWYWLPAFFVLVLLYGVFTLWTLVGVAKASAAMVITVTAIVFTFLLAN
jgi:hypothetical protein